MNRSQTIRINRARKLVLSGDYQSALPKLELLAQEIAAPHATLAEIRGFLFDWEAALEHAGTFIASPLAAYVDNVFTDMIELSGRAARETKNWAMLHNLCESAIEAIGQQHVGHARERYLIILENLKKYAEREGTAPHELVRVFGYQSDIDRMSEQRKRTLFEQAVAATDTLRPDLINRPAARLQHQMSLAFIYEQWDTALTLYEDNQHPPYHLEYISPLIKYMARKGQKDKARAMVEHPWPQWIPVDRVQVAPVFLLTAKELENVADADLCQQILQSPRGNL